jgi:hypothetical protein
MPSIDSYMRLLYHILPSLLAPSTEGIGPQRRSSMSLIYLHGQGQGSHLPLV